jgi:hypothetical protein
VLTNFVTHGPSYVRIVLLFKMFKHFKIYIDVLLRKRNVHTQNVKLFRAVHSFIKRSKQFENNILI